MENVLAFGLFREMVSDHVYYSHKNSISKKDSF
jgi:hypothetical protein